jgi:DNA polymerase I-like protein with 3'-5' exonuclease and polymerase domains
MRWFGHEPQVNEVKNFPIQGGAADLINRVAPEIEDELPRGCFFVAQVHDELVVDAPITLGERIGKKMRAIAEQEIELNGHVVSFPVDVKIKQTWGDKGVKLAA